MVEVVDVSKPFTRPTTEVQPMFNSLNHPRLRLALAGLALSQAGLALANPPAATGSSANNEYLAHWDVTTWTSKTKGVDLQAQIDLSKTTIVRDIVMLYESQYGKFPLAGVHMYYENSKWKADHFAAMAKNIAVAIPDVNYSGYICIDYEQWQPNWKHQWNDPSPLALDAMDNNFKDDWEKWVKLNHPNWLAGKSGDAYQAVLESTYNEATKEFFLDTLKETKRLRPNAKVGFYCFPVREFYTDYAPRASVWHTVNDELKWMFDAEDVIFPSTYQIMELVEGKALTPGKPQALPKDNGRYISDNVKEAVRVSQGKPVLDFIWFKYHGWLGAPLGNTPIPDTAMQQMLQLPKEAGAKGVVIWDCIQSADDFNWLKNVEIPKASKLMDSLAVKPSGGPGSSSSNQANKGGPGNSSSTSQNNNSNSPGNNNNSNGKTTAGAVVLPNGRVIISSAPIH